MAADFLAALAPRAVFPSVGGAAEESTGAIFTALATGIAKGVQFIQSPKGKKLLAKLKDTEEKAAQRQKLYQAKAARAKTPEARERWLRRARRQQARLDDARLSRTLAEKGIIGEPAQLEYKRNLLAMEWEDAKPERKKEIEDKISRMDARLKQLHREKVLLERTLAPSKPAPEPKPDAKTGAQEEAAMRVPWGRRGRVLSPVPRTVSETLMVTDKKIVSGMGALRYRVQSPPGPGRLVRIPFYPVDDANSWSGPGGIDFKNDDPVVRLLINGSAGNTRLARTLKLRTERFDYGSYRILGFQVNEQGNYKPTDYALGPPFDLGGIVIVFRNLALYNGQDLFLQDDGIWSKTFNIRPGSTQQVGNFTAGPSNTRFELPVPYQRRRNRWFVGLRDYPLVTGTTYVSIECKAFSRLAADPGRTWEIPMTCNIVAEMVEDKVFGDPVNPSPAARAGATVKVAAREVGTDWRGVEQIELVSAQHRRLTQKE